MNPRVGLVASVVSMPHRFNGFVIAIVVAFACAAFGCSSTIDSLDTAAERIITTSMALPISALTPGDTLAVDAKTICEKGYSASVRKVNAAEKLQVAAAYHYTGLSHDVEYDHLISLELGGSNSPKNLWPQPIADARIKDGLEHRLHAEVCSGKRSLKDAQQQIAADWVRLLRDSGLAQQM
jgi:hypothetical protein